VEFIDVAIHKGSFEMQASDVDAESNCRQQHKSFEGPDSGLGSVTDCVAVPELRLLIYYSVTVNYGAKKRCYGRLKRCYA
jgi:hypothetical protein